MVGERPQGSADSALPYNVCVIACVVPVGCCIQTCAAQYLEIGGLGLTRLTMATTSDEMKIVLQVGTELRITNKGEVILSNPELELAREDRAADAVLLYKFNPSASEHTFRLVDPLADRKHTKVHRPGD